MLKVPNPAGGGVDSDWRIPEWRLGSTACNTSWQHEDRPFGPPQKSIIDRAENGSKNYGRLGRRMIKSQLCVNWCLVSIKPYTLAARARLAANCCGGRVEV
jgi:hypothetical protein